MVDLEDVAVLAKPALGDRLASGLNNLGFLLQAQGDLVPLAPTSSAPWPPTRRPATAIARGVSFYGLGSLAFGLGRKVEGARLVAICCLIDQEIGRADVEQDMRNLTTLTEQLDYSAEQRDKLVSEVRQADLGWDLIRDAFAGTDGQSSGSEPQAYSSTLAPMLTSRRSRS